MTQSHAQIPWSVMMIGKKAVIVDANGFGVEMDDKTAAFIVKAVNEHEAMRTALDVQTATATALMRDKMELMELVEALKDCDAPVEIIRRAKP